MCSISGFLVTEPAADRRKIANWYADVIERSAERGRDSAGVVAIDAHGGATRIVSLAPTGYDFVHQAISPTCTLLIANNRACLLYTSPSPRDGLLSRMPSSA